MVTVVAFLKAALPWIVVGLVLAVFLAGSGKKKKDDGKTDHYGTEDTSLGNNTGIGISLGMLMGLAIGSCIKKGNQDQGDGEQ